MAEYDCPRCDRSFPTRRGLAVHHSQVHGECLPNRTCAECGASFYSEYEKKYCSDDCRDVAVSVAGVDNPNYRNASSRTSCVLCGATFEYYPSEKPGYYCSDCVETEAWRTPIDLDGENNPRWKGGRRRMPCDVCGAVVTRYPSNADGDVVLCSEACRSQWLSEIFTGDGHPNWNGGGVGSYGPGWAAVRRAALERDGYECVLCGTSRADLGRNPDVHHIVPVRRFVDSPVLTISDAHSLDNVVALCPSCHRRAEFGHVTRAELRYRAGIDDSLPNPPTRGG